MYPMIFGIIDSYVVMVLLGLVSIFFLFEVYMKHVGAPKQLMYSCELNACVSVIVGLISAILVQNVYDFIEKGDAYKWTWAMTFYGGLIGGALTFLLIYFFHERKKYGPFMRKYAFRIAPAMIALAHAFGRVGCFLSGCCYGKPTDSWMGVTFPGMSEKVYPTNLMEAIFLFILAGELIFLALKIDFEYNFVDYLISYGIFRFLIEYLRGDHRGSFVPGISPSQFWSLGLIAIGIGMGIYIYITNKKAEATAS
ncbi:MAG: prolipoprotein diacylglyceryl transferase [Bacilli bacterium]|nr:prolipoprotein diacylglyceryl transferase [Bacilli bacterium]